VPTWLARRILLIALAGVGIFPAALPASAQGFSGRYAVQDASGARMVIDLVQDEHGRVTGTLTGGTSPLAVDGRVRDGLLSGTLKGPKTSGFFEAQLAADTLVLTLMEPDTNHQPDRSRAGKVRLTRESTTLGDSAPTARPAH